MHSESDASVVRASVHASVRDTAINALARGDNDDADDDDAYENDDSYGDGDDDDDDGEEPL